jgi:hypothetical protein
MSGGRKSRDKGRRAERTIVSSLQDFGIAAERIPLSGAAGGKFKGDISVPIGGIDRRLEVKTRKDGFKQLYGWLPGNFGLVLKSDRKQPLVVLTIEEFIVLAVAAEKKKGAQ